MFPQFTTMALSAISVICKLSIFACIIVHCGAFRCPFPGIPKHGYGTINGEQLDLKTNPFFEEDDVIDFKCFDSWSTTWQGNGSIKCLSNGTWNSSLPKCHKVIGASDYQVTFVKNGRQLNGLEKFQCPASEYDYSIINITKTEISLTDIYEIRVEFCQNSEKSITIGVYEKKQNDIRLCKPAQRPFSEIFDCDLRNNKTLGSIKIESLQKPVALNKVSVIIRSDDYCSFPAVPVGGILEMSEDVQYLYRCLKGRYLVGQQRAICDPATGEWTLPSCIEISNDCELPANITNGLVENVEPNVIKYTCIDGFHPSGNGTVTCDETTGQWTSVPSCRLNEIDLPTDLTCIIYPVLFFLFLIILEIVVLCFCLKCCNLPSIAIQ